MLSDERLHQKNLEKNNKLKEWHNIDKRRNQFKKQRKL